MMHGCAFWRVGKANRKSDLKVCGDGGGCSEQRGRGCQTLTAPSKIRPGAYNEVVEMCLFKNRQIQDLIADFPSGGDSGVKFPIRKIARERQKQETTPLPKGTFLKNLKCDISILLQQRVPSES